MDRQPSETPPFPRRPRALRWLLRGALAHVVLVLVLAGLVLLAVSTESGTRALWHAAKSLVPGELQGEVISGSLADGLTLRDVVYQSESMVIRIDKLQSKWHLLRSPLTLDIPYLRINNTELTLLPTPAKPSKPATLPQRITLPLAVNLHEANIDKLLVRSSGQTQTFGDIRMAAHSDGQHHQVALKNADTPAGKVSASLKLNGARPFPVDGAVRLDAAYRDQQYRADAALSGTLEILGIRLQASGGKLAGNAVIEATPFDKIPFRKADIDLRNVDPSALNPQWPQGDFALSAKLQPAGNAGDDLSKLKVTGPVSVVNTQPGPIDSGRVPLESTEAHVLLDAQTQHLTSAKIRLPGDAALAGSGKLVNGAGSFTLRADRLDLHALHTALTPTRLSGPISLQIKNGTQHVKLDLDGSGIAAAADATLTEKLITLHSATVRAEKAELAVSGTLARDALSAYKATGKLRGVNPARFFATSSRIKPATGNINLDFHAQGALKPALQSQFNFQLRDSSYAGLPLTGRGDIKLDGMRLLPSHADLSIAGNELLLDGSFGEPSSRLQVRVDAPALARLGFGLAGLLQINGQVGGTLEHPLIDARYRAERLAFDSYHVANLQGEAHVNGMPGREPNAKVELKLQAGGMDIGIANLTRLNANINGTYANHTIDLAAVGRLRGTPLDAALSAQGTLRQQQQGMSWRGTISKLENQGAPRLSLQSPLPVSVAPGSIDLGSARLTLARANIALESLHFDESAIRSAGRITALNVGHLLELRRQFTGAAAPFNTNLVLDGEWDFRIDNSASGFVRIDRQSGDVRLPGERALGLSALSARLDLQGMQAVVNAQTAASRIGNASVQGRVTMEQVGKRLGITPDAPLAAKLQATVPKLQTLGELLGPQLALGGSIVAILTATGTIADPRLSGSVDGEGLAVTLFEPGIRLRDGVARLRLADNVVDLREVVFHSGEGTLRASGSLPLGEPVQGLAAVVTADRLQLLSDPSAQVTVSGRANIATVDRIPQVTGSFTVDRALLSLPDKAAPKLDNDVIVIRGGKSSEPQATGGEKIAAASREPASPFSPRIDVQVNLGKRFRFVGSGADLLLAGTVNVRSAPGEPVQAFGTVRVVKGSYETFGAELAIERGIINFDGPTSNPNINILAMRRGQEVEAGVQVTGTIAQPRVQLVSEPNVAEEEKLSWLVFGRAPGAETGASTSLGETAALGLLNKFGGNRIAEGLGLDELSIGESEYGLAGKQVVNLGKEISDRLSIGFEHSLGGAESVLKLTYELARQWSIVVRGGTVAGIDLFYSKRFDTIR